MDLRLYMRLFRRRWLVILLITVLGAAAAAAVARTHTSTYAAKEGLFVSVTNPGADPGQAYQGTLLAQQRAKSYTTLLTDDHVLRTLIDQLHLPYSVSALRGEISASNPDGTAVINVTVKDPSATRAMAIASAYGSVFPTFAATLEATPGSDKTPVPTVATLAPSELVPQRVAPHSVVDTALGAVAGLVVGVCWAVAREVTDTRIRDAEDAARACGAPVLALLPGGAAGLGGPLLSNGQRRPLTVEAYRRLGVNIQLLGSKPAPLAFVVTGPSGGEGATTAAVDLAISFAEGGERVILVDTDLWRPGLSALLGLLPATGLRDVLAGRAPLEQALQQWREGLPLHVLTSGPPAPGTHDVLRQQRVDALCRELGHRADVVIFAAPPLLLKTDAVILARAVGQALLVARSRATRAQELTEAVGYLHTAGVAVLGVVLTGPAGRRGRRRTGATAPKKARTHGPGRPPDDVFGAAFTLVRQPDEPRERSAPAAFPDDPGRERAQAPVTVPVSPAPRRAHWTGKGPTT